MTADHRELTLPWWAAVVPRLMAAAIVLAVFRTVEILVIVAAGAILTSVVLHGRTSLVLAAGSAEIRQPFRAPRVVAWRDVRALRPGSWLRSGMVFETTDGTVWSAVPTRWWGPPTPEQVAEVERWWLDHRGAGPEATI